jgi:predicted oxidoreductase
MVANDLWTDSTKDNTIHQMFDKEFQDTVDGWADSTNVQRNEAAYKRFDPFKFEALNKAVEGQLVTNQIEWNPLCYEHFKSGMIDYLSGNRIHPMIWSPLAGGRIFKETDDEVCTAVRTKIEEIAERHGVSPATIIYAWILYHPVGAIALVGSSKLERLDLAIRALDVKLKHSEWFEIYAAGGQQIR